MTFASRSIAACMTCISSISVAEVAFSEEEQYYVPLYAFEADLAGREEVASNQLRLRHFIDDGFKVISVIGDTIDLPYSFLTITLQKQEAVAVCHIRKLLEGYGASSFCAEVDR